MASEEPRVTIRAGTDGLFRWYVLAPDSAVIHSATQGYVSRRRAEEDLREFGAFLVKEGYAGSPLTPGNSLREVQARGAEAIHEAESQRREAIRSASE